MWPVITDVPCALCLPVSLPVCLSACLSVSLSVGYIFDRNKNDWTSCGAIWCMDLDGTKEWCIRLGHGGDGTIFGHLPVHCIRHLVDILNLINKLLILSELWSSLAHALHTPWLAPLHSCKLCPVLRHPIFSIPSREIGLEKRLPNKLHFVGGDSPSTKWR